MQNPAVGKPGGQQYRVLNLIQTTIAPMAEGHIASTIIKELLQNADDAKASEITVI